MRTFILLLFFIPFSLFAQNKDLKIYIYKGMRSGSNQIGKDGKKQGLWYERFKVRYGQLGYNTVYIGKYKGGKREGVWKRQYLQVFSRRRDLQVSIKCGL